MIQDRLELETAVKILETYSDQLVEQGIAIVQQKEEADKK
jgi:hypothetical protein